jgi:PAS domain S-box-containing protein
LRPVVWFAPWGYLLAAMLEFIVALGMLLAYFRKARGDLEEGKYFLQMMAERLDLATRAARLGIWDWDLGNDELIWDDRMYALYGLKKTAFPDAHEARRRGFHPDDRLENDSVLEQARRGEKEYDTEFRVVWPDGTIRSIKALGQVQWDSGGNPVRMTGINYDITELKELEARLQQSQKMESIGNLAGGIAHDFNNILFPIVGMAELLLEDLPSGSQEYENAGEILKAGRRGSDLVQQILAFSRRADHKMIPFRIQPVLEEVLKLSRFTIPANIEINEDIEDDCGPIMGDPVQLHQIAMNLMTNAYHATEEAGGTISVQLREAVFEIEDSPAASLNPGPYAVLVISDTGCGIDPGHRDKIFDPYFTTKAQGKGTGLGLAVAYGIIKEHRGDIQVYSEKGKGTTFEVYLPLLEASLKGESAKRLETHPRGNEKILLVDDEASAVQVERLMLEKLGYAVTPCFGSVDALNRFKADPHAFDLVITDMTMPKMTGDALARELTLIRPGMPIIICTGFSERINHPKAKLTGIRKILKKPISKSEMAGTVRKVLDEAKDPLAETWNEDPGGTKR